MARMHADELAIDEPLVRGLLREQFPEWAAWTLEHVEPGGTDHAAFRLGDRLSVRLARRRGPTTPGGRESTWPPRLAPALPVWQLHSPSARDALIRALAADDASWERARGWAVSQAVAIPADGTPRSNPVLCAEADRWLALALEDR